MTGDRVAVEAHEGGLRFRAARADEVEAEPAVA